MKTLTSPILFDCVSDFETVAIFECQMFGLFFKDITRPKQNTNFNNKRILACPISDFHTMKIMLLIKVEIIMESRTM